jgi:hypothetical protein
MAAVAPIANPNTTQFYHGAAPRFKYVYYANAMTKGEIAQWTDSADATTRAGYSVQDADDQSTRVAGVCPATVAAAGYAWLQTGGYCDYVTTDTAVVAPNADSLAGDVYLIAANNSGAPRAVGQSSTEFMAQCNAGTATCGPTSAFALNMAVDSSAVGACILICNV